MTRRRPQLARVLLTDRHPFQRFASITATCTAPPLVLGWAGLAIGHGLMPPGAVGPLVLGILGATTASIMVFVLNRRLVRSLRRWRTEVWLCRRCSYDLRSLESSVCPECGEYLP